MDEIRRKKNSLEPKAESLKFKAETGGGPRRARAATDLRVVGQRSGSSNPRSDVIPDETRSNDWADRGSRSPSRPQSQPSPMNHEPSSSQEIPPAPRNPPYPPLQRGGETVDILAPILRVWGALRQAAARLAAAPLRLWRWLPSRIAALARGRFSPPLAMNHEPRALLSSPRLRAAVATFAVFALSIGLFQILKSPEGVEASWWDESWIYRIPIIITGDADSNKKIKLDINTNYLSSTNTQMQPDCGDSRFTDIQGKELPYFIDQSGGACNTTSTDYYVLVDTFNSPTTVIYHYYGNPGAENGSRSVQFSEATYTPSLISAGSEEKPTFPQILYYALDSLPENVIFDSSGSARHGSFRSGGRKSPVELLASDAADSDFYGYSVALSGDGSIMAVGAINWEGAAGLNRGGVYIYDKVGADWVQRGSVLEASDAADSDQFGRSVSLSGSGAVLAVGAYAWEGAAGSNRGGVYIFDWNGAAWVQRGSVLEASDGANSDSFYYVSLTYDATVLAVGAYAWEGAAGSNRGGVYIFDWNGAAWVQRGSVLEASDGADNDFFHAAALSADGNLLVVGAQGYAWNDTGRIYIYERQGDGWVYTGTSIGQLTYASYGNSVDISNYGNTITIGSLNLDDSGFADVGAVYRLYQENGSWVSGETWKIHWSLIQAQDWLGSGVAESENGSVRAAGAAGWEGDSGTNRGRVLTYNLGAKRRAPEDCVSGTCLELSNGDGIITASNLPLTFEPWTFSIWLKNTANRNYNQTIISNFYKSFYVKANTREIYYSDGTATQCELGMNEWHNFAFTQNSNTMSVYLDGNLCRTFGIGGLSSGMSFEIGTETPVGEYYHSDNWFQGFVDEIRFFDTNLEESQIKRVYSYIGNSRAVSARFGEARNILNDGLVGYWKLDEASGAATDSSGNAQTLTDASTTTFAVGKFGNGADLESSSTDYQYIADNATLSLTSSITVSAWIKPESVTAATLFDIAGKWDGANESYLLAQYGDEIRLYVDAAANYATTNAANLAAGTWYHVVAVYDAQTATVRIMVNGAIQASTVSGTIPASIGDDAGRFHIGAEDSTGGAANYYDGIVDEVRLYNRALSEGEVRQLYNWAPGPVGYWDFDENAGAVAYDKSGNGNTGSLTNGPVWAPGQFGSGVSFDGSNDYISIADTSLLSPGSGDYTVAAYIKASASGGADIDIYSNIGTDVNSFMNLAIISSSNPNCYISDPGRNTATATGTAAVNDDTWHHVACVLSGNNLFLYLDGALHSTANAASVGAIDTTGRVKTIGTKATLLGGGNNFTGSIDDVKVYNYARTPAQIIEDMNAGHPAPGSPVGSAVSYWAFDEGALNTCSGGTNDYCDQSPAANDLAFSTTTGGYATDGKQGFAWNGTNAVWASRADDADFDFGITEPLSLAFWFRSDAAANPGATQYLVNKASATAAGYAVYATTNGYICVGIDDDATWGPDVSSCTATDIYDATWHHVVATRDVALDTTNIYVDGVLKDSDNDSTTATLENALSFYVGDRDGTDNGDEFAGDIDELKVYREALNSDQVRVEFNAGKSTVLGSTGTTSAGVGDNSAARAYCVPGDSTSCSAPVGEWKFDENTGTTVNDTSGNGYSGTWNGSGEHWASGKNGSSGRFDGSTDWVSLGVPSNTLFPNNNSWTVGYWFKLGTTTPAASQRIFVTNRGATAGTAFWLGTSSTNLYLIYYNGSSLITNQLNDTLASMGTTWHHLEVTFDGTNFFVYRDGAYSQTVTISVGAFSGFGTYNAWFGSNEGLNNFYNGLVDNIRVYDYQRTPAQIAWDYNQGAPVAWYKFNECQGATAYNSALNGNGEAAGMNGTITPGASGNTSVGTCGSGTSTEMWNDGTTGKWGASLGFDGVDDRVVVSDPAAGLLDFGTGPMAISVWVMTSQTPAAIQPIVDKKQGGSNAAGYNINLNTDGRATFRVANGTTQSSVSSPSNVVINDGVWHHVAGTYERSGGGDTIRIYVDGELHGTTSVTAGWDINSAYDLDIGRLNSSGTYLFDGLIDDVRIYNYPLTLTQVRDVYNDGAVNFQ